MSYKRSKTFNHSEKWVNSFRKFSYEERATALTSLISICDAGQIQHLYGLIVPKLKRDFISSLPSELSLHILQYLEPKDLFKAAQTCRKWNLLCKSDFIWEKKCQFEGFFDDRESSESFKEVYRKQKTIEHNWRYGRFPDDLTMLHQPQNARKCKMLEVIKVNAHGEKINCLQFNPESKIIVSGSNDCSLKVWSSISGECLHTLAGHTAVVWSSQLSFNNILISGSADKTIKIWDAMSGNCLQTLHGHTSTVNCLSLHGNHFVSGSRDKTCRVWAIESGSCCHILSGHSDDVRCVHFDGELIVSGGYDYLLKLWDFKTGICLRTFMHGSKILDLQCSENCIISGSCDATIRVFAADSKVLKLILKGHKAPITCLRLRKKILVSGSIDCTVKVWDLSNERCLHILTGHSRAISNIEINDKFILSTSNDGKVKLWDVKTGKFIRDLVFTNNQIWSTKMTSSQLICTTGSPFHAQIFVLNFI